LAEQCWFVSVVFIRLFQASAPLFCRARVPRCIASCPHDQSHGLFLRSYMRVSEGSKKIHGGRLLSCTDMSLGLDLQTCLEAAKSRDCTRRVCCTHKQMSDLTQPGKQMSDDSVDNASMSRGGDATYVSVDP
jgi:hypothetical protein